MAASHEVTLGYTLGGKRITARMVSNRSLHEIVMEGGGQMPVELQGVFSGLVSCQKAYDTYIARMKEGKRPSNPRSRKKKIELSDDSDV